MQSFALRRLLYVFFTRSLTGVPATFSIVKPTSRSEQANAIIPESNSLAVDEICTCSAEHVGNGEICSIAEPFPDEELAQAGCG